MTFGHEKRREPRERVSLPATLRHYRDHAEVELVDVSNGGAMVKAEAPPARGEEVVLVRGRIQIVATIAWVEDQHCGLCFHRPIDKQALVEEVVSA